MNQAAGSIVKEDAAQLLMAYLPLRRFTQKSVLQLTPRTMTLVADCNGRMLVNQRLGDRISSCKFSRARSCSTIAVLG